MLDCIGIESTQTLWDQIPKALQLGRPLRLHPPLAEGPLLRQLRGLAAKNVVAADPSRFLGAGIYHHFRPVIQDQLLLRSEFYTAYTPYQPEIAQGTLQAMYEFQTLICQLTGMEVANASLYEGASATAESVLMADRVARGKKPWALLSQGVHPEYRETVRSYVQFTDIKTEGVPLDERGLTSPETLAERVCDETACVVVQYPNFLGGIEDLQALAEVTHQKRALFVVVVTDPVALAQLESPGALGADIVCGEGQALGVPLHGGGPVVGLFATKEQHLRAIPGRLCGRTVDAEGRPGFVLTMSTREQHIRREKATSNICTNQGLMALASTIWMAAMGKAGLTEMARQCHTKARFLKRRLAAVPGVRIPYSAPTFHEFVWETDQNGAQVLREMAARGLGGGVALGRWDAAQDKRILTAVTEQNDREHIDRFVAAVSEIVGGAA
jgi:glycine dehydrogenase subunit 1